MKLCFREKELHIVVATTAPLSPGSRNEGETETSDENQTNTVLRQKSINFYSYLKNNTEEYFTKHQSKQLSVNIQNQ